MADEERNMFVFKTRLRVSSFCDKFLNKRMYYERCLYNEVIDGINKIPQFAKFTKLKKEIDDAFKNRKGKTEEERKEIDKQIKELKDTLRELRNEIKNLPLSEFDKDSEILQSKSKYTFGGDFMRLYELFHSTCKNKVYGINSTTFFVLAARLEKALHKFLWENGKTLNKSEQFNSISIVKTAALTGVKIDLLKNDLSLIKNGKPLCTCRISPKNDVYSKHAIDSIKNEDGSVNKNVRVVTVAKTMKNGKAHYELQLTIEGTPFRGEEKNNRNKVKLGNAIVGIDPRPDGIAYVTSNGDCDIISLINYIPEIKKFHEKIAKLEQKNDKICRELNPTCYNEDDTTKSGVVYKKNNEYRRNAAKIHTLHAKLTRIVELSMYDIIKEKILPLGNEFKVEKSKFSTWMIKSYENELGKITNSNAKVRRMMKNCAPSKFLSILEHLVKVNGGKFVEINDTDAKATKYDHTKNNWDEKHKPTERILVLSDGYCVHRDFHSAFNIMCYNNETKSYDINAINKYYPVFKNGQDKYVNEICAGTKPKHYYYVAIIKQFAEISEKNK